MQSRRLEARLRIRRCCYFPALTSFLSILSVAGSNSINNLKYGGNDILLIFIILAKRIDMVYYRPSVIQAARSGMAPTKLSYFEGERFEFYNTEMNPPPEKDEKREIGH